MSLNCADVSRSDNYDEGRTAEHPPIACSSGGLKCGGSGPSAAAHHPSQHSISRCHFDTNLFTKTAIYIEACDLLTGRYAISLVTACCTEANVRPFCAHFICPPGKKYWLFSGNRPLPGYPRPLTDLGLPATLTHLDAALVWGHNGKTYFFSGDKYWRYDETDRSVELDYPRHIRMWRGVPHGVDAAFQYSDGKHSLPKTVLH